MIESYSFGNIVVDGKRYFHDLIIFPDKIKENWRRKEGHKLYLDDIKEVFLYSPETLVIGTGYFGKMKITEEVKKRIEEKGINLFIEKTQGAVKKLNKLLEQNRKAVGAFHLSC